MILSKVTSSDKLMVGGGFLRPVLPNHNPRPRSHPLLHPNHEQYLNRSAPREVARVLAEQTPTIQCLVTLGRVCQSLPMARRQLEIARRQASWQNEPQPGRLV